LIEVDGGAGYFKNPKGQVIRGGRHNRKEGYEDDCRKLNTAALKHGFTILRFTSGMVSSRRGQTISFRRICFSKGEDKMKLKTHAGEHISAVLRQRLCKLLMATMNLGVFEFNELIVTVQPGETPRSSRGSLEQGKRREAREIYQLAGVQRRASKARERIRRQVRRCSH